MDFLPWHLLRAKDKDFTYMQATSFRLKDGLAVVRDIPYTSFSHDAPYSFIVSFSQTVSHESILGRKNHASLSFIDTSMRLPSFLVYNITGGRLFQIDFKVTGIGSRGDRRRVHHGDTGIDADQGIGGGQ
ncbi:hypothetical protein S40288_10779 [Stachybotrys chartarum IBT 40288]|nr:hypothetical protein S40288_10779 [Stachybotrys chartarum IBT 40288]